MTQFHPFHIVYLRPWPLLIGAGTLNLFRRVIFWISNKNISPLLFNLVLTILIRYQWWRDISRERRLQGFHRNYVILILRWGIILFITSEVLFFLSFFWSFFHGSLAPNFEMGNTWPPLGIIAINPFQVPLLNTAILLRRGIAVTWRHHALIFIKNNQTKFRLIITVLLGFYFSALQAWEYWDSSFSLTDSSYGTVFFVATGFHGLHVLIGSLFLLFSYFRIKINILSKIHHVGFERAIWYWHFVDVVWLFLYCFVYWWAFYSINIKKYI